MIQSKLNGKYTLLIPEHRQENWRNSWEVERTDELYKNIKLGDIVFDIGAEEGDISALMGTWGAEVVLFEPSPGFWPTIRELFEANHVQPRGCFVGFVSNENQAAPPNLNFDSSHREIWPEVAYEKRNGTVGFRHLSQETDATPQIRVDDWVARGNRPPDIMNIDVEGAELEVIKGAVQTIIQSKPLIFISIHPIFMYENHKQFDHDLQRFMVGLGYQYKVLAWDHEWHVMFWHEEGRLPNYEEGLPPR